MNKDLLLLIIGYTYPCEGVMMVSTLNNHLLLDQKFWISSARMFPERAECKYPKEGIDKNYHSDYYSHLFQNLFEKKLHHIVHFLIKTLPPYEVLHIVKIPSDFFLPWILEDSTLKTNLYIIWFISINTSNLYPENLSRIIKHPLFSPNWLYSIMENASLRDDPQTLEDAFKEAQKIIHQIELEKHLYGNFTQALRKGSIKVINFYCQRFIEDFKSGCNSIFTLNFISTRFEWFECADQKAYLFLLDFMRSLPSEMRQKIKGDRVEISIFVMRRFGNNTLFIKELFSRAEGFRYNMSDYLEYLVEKDYTETLRYIFSIYDRFNNSLVSRKDSLEAAFIMAVKHQKFDLAKYLIKDEFKGKISRNIINKTLSNISESRNPKCSIDFLIHNFPSQINYRMLKGNIPMA